MRIEQYNYSLCLPYFVRYLTLFNRMPIIIGVDSYCEVLERSMKCKSRLRDDTSICIEMIKAIKLEIEPILIR
jgi:hypothetical protein